MTIPSYLQRFREKFADWKIHHKDLPCFQDHVTLNRVEEFITQERQQLIQEAVELGEGLKKYDKMEHDVKNYCDFAANAAITAYQELIRTNLK